MEKQKWDQITEEVKALMSKHEVEFNEDGGGYGLFIIDDEKASILMKASISPRNVAHIICKMFQFDTDYETAEIVIKLLYGRLLYRKRNFTPIPGQDKKETDHESA
jgi:hypothetical protein